MGYRQNSEPIIGQNGLSGRLYFSAGSARPRSRKKVPLTYTWQKNMGVFGKNGPFQGIYFRRASPGRDTVKSPLTYTWQKYRRVSERIGRLEEIYFKWLPSSVIRKKLSNYMWLKNRPVFGRKRPFLRNIFIGITRCSALPYPSIRKKSAA